MNREPVPSDVFPSIDLLLIEDNSADADLIRAALGARGSTEFEITHVARLADARRPPHGHDFHVMLLDLSLAGGRGLEILRRARATSPVMPIVVMVGLNDEALVLRAVQSGAQDYLIKGCFDPRNLTRTVRHAIERQRILTDLGEAREREHYRAMHDALTDLANRHLFLELINQALEHAKRYCRSLAVLFVDIDRFKAINDSLGHSVGDELLRVFARRLSNCVRLGDVVARLGGDEFTIMLSDVSCLEQVGTVARKALRVVSEPYVLKDHDLYITASMGIAVYPEDGEDVGALFRNADAAMYSAKEQGRNRYQFCTHAMNAASLKRRDAIRDARSLLRRKASRNLFRA
jgi:diguanylate cyclase (GGDEF)-like protein